MTAKTGKGGVMERCEKICIYCTNYISETATLEGECKIDEDVHSEEHCNSYTKRSLSDDGR